MTRARSITRAALLVLLVAALVGAVVVAGTRRGGPETTRSPAATPSSPPALSPAESPSPDSTLDADAALRLLGSVEAAAEADPEELLLAGLIAGQGPWHELADPAWPMEDERPVYVGRAEIDGGSVTADVVIAHRVTATTGELVLRLLPAAVDGNGLTVTATAGGRDVDATAEPGGLLRIGLPADDDTGAAVSVRVRIAYDVLPVGGTSDEHGPAAYGILARSESVIALGHWLPLLTYEPDPIVPWGDVGSFPAAVWSVQVEHTGSLVTGGIESDCPGPVTVPCTWSRGLALRDLSAVLFDDPSEARGAAEGLQVRAVATRRIGSEVLATLVDEAVASAEGLTRRFGPVAWEELDIAVVPLGRGAAGMEFPGIVLVDDQLHRSFGGGFGTYVLVHEVAHQWFHALVGNGSFADPVVDESLAQYLSVLSYRDLFGPAAAEELVDERLAERYRRFLDSGREDEPPAQPSGDFTGAASYGPMVYARGALAWIAAEEAVGADVVATFLAGLVRAYGLEVVTAGAVLDEARGVNDGLAVVLRRYWYSDDPVPVP